MQEAHGPWGWKRTQDQAKAAAKMQNMASSAAARAWLRPPPLLASRPATVTSAASICARRAAP